jgi:hypothetical protein
MNFWEFWDRVLSRLPGWPTEKQLVMLTTFAMGFMMIMMAKYDPALWGVELFKTLITVVIVTGCINMILAFYFTANKSDENRDMLAEKRADNTGKAFDAIAAMSSTENKESDTITLETNSNGN